MIVGLVSGTLFRDPKACTSKGGRAYTMATVKVSDATGSDFVRVFAWSDHAREALEGLKDGDALSVTGKLSTEIYTPPNGAARVSLSIAADQLIVLKKPVRKKEAAATAEGAKGSGMRRIGDSPNAPSSPPNGGFLDDQIPF